MEIIKKYGLIFASAILLATAVFVSVNKSDGITARAEGTDYTATWTATKILALNIVESKESGQRRWSGAGYVPSFDIPLGVAEWDVQGFDQQRSILFTEKWSVPTGQLRISAGNILSSGPGFTGTAFGCEGFSPGEVGLKYESGLNSTEWLVGLFSRSLCGKTVIKNLGDLVKIEPSDSGLKRHRLGNSSCFDWYNSNDADCFTSSGAYGFINGHAIDDDGSRAGIQSAGVIMPLKWTVTGKIY